jgi:hypothetical protein
VIHIICVRHNFAQASSRENLKYSPGTLIGTYNYYLYTGDTEWLQETWSNYTKGVAYIAGKINGTGLVDVTGLRDWGRLGQGGYNAEANAIYYKVFIK